MAQAVATRAAAAAALQAAAADQAAVAAHRVAAVLKHRKYVVYLMRGVPASGKSYAAKKLAGRKGAVCETDSYFGPPGKKYYFDSWLVGLSRKTNMSKFSEALSEGLSPIVVDRGNGKGHRTRWYVQKALDAGYTVEFAEPVSKWWPLIRKAIIQKKKVDHRLKNWSIILAKKQTYTHGVEQWRILKSLNKFDPELTIEKILEGE